MAHLQYCDEGKHYKGIDCAVINKVTLNSTNTPCYLPTYLPTHSLPHSLTLFFYRKVVSESSTGSTEKSSLRLNLTVSVEDVFFDATVGVLRINGRNMTEHKDIKVV